MFERLAAAWEILRQPHRRFGIPFEGSSENGTGLSIATEAALLARRWFGLRDRLSRVRCLQEREPAIPCRTR